MCFIFGNVAYLGIPVLEFVKGESAVPILALVVASYLFWIFTLVVFYLEYSLQQNRKNLLKNILKNILKNPLLLAVLFGCIINFF